jgi:CheY-like chemotaxis protein
LTDKILVVDDEPDILDLARKTLVEAGYQVIEAYSGDEALIKANLEIPDLIILDVVMPGKSGLDVCKILKTQDRTKHIPVVMFTVLGRNSDKQLSIRCGANGHLVKPFESEDFLSEIKMYLEGSKAIKFSRQLELKHKDIIGKIILLEFDPSFPYERAIRDFVYECVFYNKVALVLTHGGSVIQNALKGDNGVEILNISYQQTLSEVLERYSKESLCLVYDSITNITLSTNVESAYGYFQNALKFLSEFGITAIFLLNPLAHEPKDVSSIKGLFSNQIKYNKNGLTKIRLM